MDNSLNYDDFYDYIFKKNAKCFIQIHYYYTFNLCSWLSSFQAYKSKKSFALWFMFGQIIAVLDHQNVYLQIHEA